MEDLIDALARGNVTEVKVVLASIALALALYQLGVIAIAYGRVRTSRLAPAPAGRAHRAVGDVIAALLVVTAVVCVGYYGVEGEGAVHVLAGCALLIVLALKIAVVRRATRLGGLLPALGMSVFVLLAITWLSSAGGVLADR